MAPLHLFQVSWRDYRHESHITTVEARAETQTAAQQKARAYVRKVYGGAGHVAEFVRIIGESE